MTDVDREHVVIAIYVSHGHAAAALRTLQRSGFDMKKWSILGKDVLAQQHAFGFYSNGDSMKFLARPSAIWSSVWSILSGGGFFFIPPVGPLVVMGPLVEWVVDALATASAGAEADVPAAALMRIGVAKDYLAQCALAVNTGNFVVLARGSAFLMTSAHAALVTTGASQLTLAMHADPEYFSFTA
ncbi:MAG: permease [Kofleriaceae bacterium]